MIVGQEPASDRLEINTLAGTDTVDEGRPEVVRAGVRR